MKVQLKISSGLGRYDQVTDIDASLATHLAAQNKLVILDTPVHRTVVKPTSSLGSKPKTDPKEV